MKRSELIETYRDEIETHMTDIYREVLESKGRMQCTLYIWSDGELQDLWDVQGSNTYLQARDHESRTLYRITLIDSPCFDYRDYVADGDPDADGMEDEVIDWLVDEYNAADVLDWIIKEAKEDERYDD